MNDQTFRQIYGLDSKDDPKVSKELNELIRDISWDEDDLVNTEDDVNNTEEEYQDETDLL